MGEKILVSKEELLAVLAKIFEHHGASTANARATACGILAAEFAGQKGHGISRVQSYSRQLASGKVDGKAKPKIEFCEAGALRIDAAHGFAYPALELACERLPEIARTQNIAAASIYRSHHAGALGVVAEKLAEVGLVSLVFANTPKAMAPYGGKAAIFGTNPIAFGAPRAAAPPLVIDLALSNVARGKVLAAAQNDEPIPEGWALDAQGQPTQDANAALEGTMVPAAGHKGAALALMVEILAVAITGANPSFAASSFFNEEGHAPGVGQFIIAISPSNFSGGLFAALLEEIIQAIEQDGARLPGSRRIASRDELAEQGGILLNKSEYNQLVELQKAKT